MANVNWERPTDVMWRKNDVDFVSITDVMCVTTLWRWTGSGFWKIRVQHNVGYKLLTDVIMFVLTHPTRFHFHFSSPSIACAFSVHYFGIFVLCFEFLRFSIQFYFTLCLSFTLSASFKRCHSRFKLRSRYPWFQVFSCSFLLHVHLLSLFVVFYWPFICILWFW